MINIIETNNKKQISQQVDSTQVIEKNRIYKRSIINNYDGDYNGCLKDIHKRIIGKIGTLSYSYPNWQLFPINLTQCISLAKKWSDSIQKRIDFADKIVVIFFVMAKRIIQIEVKARLTTIENITNSANIQSQMDMSVEQNIGTKIEQNIGTKFESKIESKIESKLESKLEQNISTKFELKIKELVQEIRNVIAQEFKNEFEQEFKKMFELEIAILKNEFKQEIASLKTEFKLSILKNLKEITSLKKETNNFKPIKPIETIKPSKPIETIKSSKPIETIKSSKPIETIKSSKPIQITNSIEIIMDNNKINISEKNIQSTNINNYSRYSNNNYGFRGKALNKPKSPYKDALLKQMQDNEENL